MMYVDMKKNQTGFTLIELLVSISIIAILTALLTVNFIGARQRGRDGQRKANLYQIQAALELYRSDNGDYPVAPLGACGGQLSVNGTVYMQKIPCDPLTGIAYSYNPTNGAAVCGGVGGACTNYTIFTCLENQEDAEKDTDVADAGLCASPYVPFKLANP